MDFATESKNCRAWLEVFKGVTGVSGEACMNLAKLCHPDDQTKYSDDDFLALKWVGPRTLDVIRGCRKVPDTTYTDNPGGAVTFTPKPIDEDDLRTLAGLVNRRGHEWVEENNDALRGLGELLDAYGKAWIERAVRVLR